MLMQELMVGMPSSGAYYIMNHDCEWSETITANFKTIDVSHQSSNIPHLPHLPIAAPKHPQAPYASDAKSTCTESPKTLLASSISLNGQPRELSAWKQTGGPLDGEVRARCRVVEIIDKVHVIASSFMSQTPTRTPHIQLDLFPLPYTVPQPPEGLFRDIETEPGRSDTIAFNTALNNRDVFFQQRRCVVCGRRGRNALDHCHIVGRSDHEAVRRICN